MAEVPGAGDVLVRVQAAGVSFGDILLRAGVIPVGPKPPYTPGYDVTGVVEEVGRGVVGLRPGQPVTALVRSGGYAELVVVPADRLVAVPPGLDAVPVAAAVLNYFVAQQMLHRVAKVRPGQRILVHGAAGGVGTALLQLGRIAELTCYGTCSESKQDVVTGLGGHAIDYRHADFLATVGTLAGGGVEAVFDPVGGGHFRRSYRALRRGGILVGYGQSEAYRDGRARKAVAVGGFVGGLLLPKLVPDGRATTFYNAWSLEKKQPSAYREDLGHVLHLLATKQVEPVVAEVLPLADAAKAHELLERSAVSGKVVLTCGSAR
jgi:NADPH:quinone reductase-like Zn-dependent oxidoreductase